MSITAHTLPPCRGKVAEGRGVGGSVHIFVGACAFLWSTLPLPSAALPPGEPRLQIGVCCCALKKCFHCEPVRLSGVAIPWLNGTRLRFPSKSAAPNFTGTFRYNSPQSKGFATPLKRTGLAMTWNVKAKRQTPIQVIGLVSALQNVCSKHQFYDQLTKPDSLNTNLSNCWVNPLSTFEIIPISISPIIQISQYFWTMFT